MAQGRLRPDRALSFVGLGRCLRRRIDLASLRLAPPEIIPERGCKALLALLVFRSHAKHMACGPATRKPG